MGAVLPKAHCNRTGSSRTGTRGNFKPERWYWQKQEQVGSFSLLIVSLLQSKTRDPVRDPSAGLKHCIVIAHFSPRDTRLTASNKEVIMQQSCFCSITVSAFSALVFFPFPVVRRKQKLADLMVNGIFHVSLLGIRTHTKTAHRLPQWVW